jgi:hypothetical protein
VQLGVLIFEVMEGLRSLEVGRTDCRRRRESVF